MKNTNAKDDYARLVRAGLKLTEPRKLIYSIFLDRERRGERQRCHLTAEEIVEELRRAGKDISLSTVYRVLTLFEQSGIVLHHHFTSTTACFELVQRGKHHDHFVCLGCGGLFEFSDDRIELDRHKIAARHGFRLTDHVMVLYGLCPRCKAEGKELKGRG